jgi:hypothetical protein
MAVIMTDESDSSDDEVASFILPVRLRRAADEREDRRSLRDTIENVVSAALCRAWKIGLRRQPSRMPL